ncbi:hypothetical protein DFJ73DRAFT_137054 [Zopfochytrium polystomum]|nr:hypothetical protein DFJ73DRAFT_137054 [Zopfochytrium polystomum]
MSKEDAPLPLQPPFSAEYRPPASRRGRRANSSASLFGRLGGFGGGGGGSGVAGGGSGSGGGFGAGNGRPVDIATSSSGGGSSDGSSAGGVRTTLGSLFRSSKRSTTRLSGGGGDVEQHFDLARRASQNTLKSDRESDADSVASSTRRRASGSRSSIRSFVGGIARKFRSRDSLFAPEDLPPPVVPMPPLLDAVGSGGGGGSRGSSAFSAMTDPAQAQAQAQSQAPGVPVEPPNPWTRSWNAHPQPPTAHAALSSPPLVEAVSTKVTAESTASDSSGLRAEEPLSTGLPPLPPSHSPRFPPRITPQLADPIEAISPTTIFSVLYGSHPASAVADSTLIVGTSTATSSSTPFSSAPYPPSSFSSSSSSSFHSPPQLSPSRQSSAMEPPPALLLSHSLGETNPEPTSSDMSDACASSITPATHMDAHFTKRSESPGASAYPESSTINETALTLPRTASKRISTDAETDRSRPLSPSPTKLAISRRSFQSQTQPRPFSPSLRQSLIIGHGPVSVSHPHFATAPRRPTTTSPISTLNRSSSVRSAKSAAVIQHVVHANVASSAAKAGGKLSSAGRLFWVPDHVQASDEGIVGEDFRAWLDAARARRMAAGTSLKDFSSPPGADAPSVKTDSAAPPAAFFGNNASTASIADRPLLDHEADFPIDDPIRLARAALTRKMSFKERHVVITPDNIDEMPDAGETASAAREEDKNITDTRRGPPDPLSRNTTFRRATPSPPPASPTLRSAPPNGAALRQDAVGVGRRFSFESQSSTPSPPSSPLFSPVGHSSLHSTASPIVTIASPGRTQLNHATIPSQSVDRVISRLQEADGVDGIMEHVDHSEVRAVAFAAMEALEAAKWVDAVMSNGAAPDDLESHSVPTLAQRMEDAPLSPISPPRPQILSTTHRLHENLSDRWGGDVDDSKGEASELVGLNDITAAEGHGRLDGSGDIASDSALGSKAESIQSETESELSDSDWSNSSSPVDPESPFDPFTSLEQLVDPQMLPLSSPGRDEYLKDTSTGGTFAETEVEPSEAVPPLEKSTSTNAPSSHSEKTAISPRRVATLSINTKDLGNLDTQLKAGYPAAAVPVDVVGETPPTPESDESQNSVAPFALPAESGDLDHEQALRERQQQQHQKTPVAALEKPSTWSWFSGLMHSGSGSNAKHRKAAAIGSERAGKAVDLPTSLNNSSLSGKPGAAKIGITQRLFGGGGGGNSGSGGSGAGVGDVLQKSPILELEHDLRASGNTAATNQDWSRFPLEVEKSIYRSSHVKLAQDRRPLLQQVVISNLMLFILSVHADVTLNRQGPKRRKKGKKGQEEEKRRRDVWRQGFRPHHRC